MVTVTCWGCHLLPDGLWVPVLLPVSWGWRRLNVVPNIPRLIKHFGCQRSPSTMFKNTPAVPSPALMYLRRSLLSLGESVTHNPSQDLPLIYILINYFFLLFCWNLGHLTSMVEATSRIFLEKQIGK